LPILHCDTGSAVLRLLIGIYRVEGVKVNVLVFDRKPASESTWTKALWIYDLRTDKDFTRNTGQLIRAHLGEFVECYRLGNRHNRVATWSGENPDGRWHAYSYVEPVQRHKLSLDIFWLRDSLPKRAARLCGSLEKDSRARLSRPLR
jgi:type I restriction enzyme M protein